MGLKLSRQQRQQLLDWAAEAGDVECCGLLLGAGNVVQRIERTANVAVDPKRHFEIDPAALMAAEKQARMGGPAIVGYFHSHPNGRPSPSPDDAASASPDGRFWLIIANGEITSWVPQGDGVATEISFAPTGTVWA